MITGNSMANAVGGRTARACDSCQRRRARWYCSADDAFLCQGCDVSVHSANQLARRHERVRLHTASFKVVIDEPATNDDSTPAWHHGFTRKARTPRNAKSRQSKSVSTLSTGDHVPEMGSEFDFDNSIEQNEERLVCRVPVFEPFEDELCAGNSNIMIGDDVMVNDDAANNNIVLENGGAACTDELDVEGFLPSGVDLAEFAADVESLLEKEANDVVVKIEDDIDDEAVAMQSPSPLELTFDVDEEKVIDWGLDCIDTGVVSVVEMEGMVPQMVEEINKDIIEVGNGKCEEVKNEKRKMLLRLNYEAVMADWVSHTSRSPWTTGCRPEFDLDDEWFNCTVPCSSGNIQNQAWGDHMAKGSMRAEGIGDDKGREARVSRYREKRRTRMFSKKIRYQVRKLNAEKRPRMKGRFVKRTSLFNDQGRPSLP